MPRRFRRSYGPRPVIKSYKKVLNFAPVSRGAAANFEHEMVLGVDSLSPGQGSVTDGTVSTGSNLKFIEIQYSAVNLAAASCFINISIQLLHSGQSIVSPIIVGGNAQRNQVHHLLQFSMGQGQNSNHIFKFKIPRRFQRVREGDSWNFVTRGTANFTEDLMIIYKFYS